eukprot:COSAG06_NODE_2603_length_6593_cov_14.090699_6_plen_173_part_00
MADLEHGTWAGNSSLNAQNNPITTEFVTAMLKGKPNHMALMGADAQSDGPLQTMYDGPRPKVRAHPRASQTIQLRPDVISKLHIRSSYHDKLTTTVCNPPAECKQALSIQPPQGYSPMTKQGGIILGVGGDNSHRSVGMFFEGAIAAGYAAAGTDGKVQANIAAAYAGASSA